MNIIITIFTVGFVGGALVGVLVMACIVASRDVQIEPSEHGGRPL